jgi:hypothetical protein
VTGDARSQDGELSGATVMELRQRYASWLEMRRHDHDETAERQPAHCFVRMNTDPFCAIQPTQAAVSLFLTLELR